MPIDVDVAGLARIGAACLVGEDELSRWGVEADLGAAVRVAGFDPVSVAVVVVAGFARCAG